MSTPISNIPVQQTAQQPEEEDPEVLAILQEMQPPPSVHVQSPPNIKQVPVMSNMMYQQQQPGMMTMPMVSMESPKKPWFDNQTAQRAVYASIIALLIFYPKSFEMLYRTIPKLEAVASYEQVIRFVLLAVILYALMWKFDI